MHLHEARALGTRLMAEHDLAGWKIEFDRAKRRAGVCRYAPRVISLSAPLTQLHDEAEVRDTLLHEIAHALVGPEHGHDRVWIAAARRIGCTGLRCVPADAPQVAAAWVGVCAAGHTARRHKRPERVLLCGRCRGLADRARVFRWSHHGRSVPMHPNYAAELDALLAGRPLLRFPVGAAVRITAAGPFEGWQGTIIKVGRTSYHVRAPGGLVRVLFPAVELATS